MTQPPPPDRRRVQQFVQSVIQWAPLGGSGWAFVSFLLQQDWVLSLIMFPVMVVTAVWAAYTENFTATLRDIYSERAKNDAKGLVNFFDSLNETLQWLFYRPQDKYRKCQGYACRDYTTEEVNQPPGITNPLLTEVFVPLELSDAFVRDSEGEALPLQPGLSRYSPQVLSKLQSKDGLSIWDFLSWVKKDDRFRRMAILAWGGSGKTTLLRHITYRYTFQPGALQQAHQVPDLVPFLLYLRKWRDLLARSDAPTLADLITQHHIPDLPEGKRLKLPPHWVANLLRTGKALVMLDGFDEVAEDQRQVVSTWISEQMQNHPRTVFILTSRPAGYKDYSATKPQTTVYVKPFNAKQRERFITQWYTCQERDARAGRNTPEAVDAAHRRSQELLRQIEQREELRDMAKNPLMLNMIATFHRFYPGDELPKRRTELYQEICKLQLGDRPIAKRIAMSLSAAESQAVLQKLALQMVMNNQPRLLRQAMLGHLANDLAGIDANVQPTDFLDQIVKVSELIVKRDDRYEFTHLSFQSYLAAAEIKQQQREDLLLANWDKAWWRETTTLYVAQSRNPSKLISNLCKLGEKAAVSLAYDCFQATPRQVDEAIETELLQLAQELKILRYEDLEQYLKQHQWRKADKETYRLMINAVGKEVGQYFTPEELLNFPCEDLKRIDGLWMRHSKGKFGFSVQKQIYVDCGAQLDGKDPGDKIWYDFCDRVGWHKRGNYMSYEDLTANPSISPRGEFPYGGGWVDWSGEDLFSRIETCKL